MTLIAFHQQGWHGLADPEFLPAIPDVSLWLTQPGTVLVSSACRTVTRQEISGKFPCVYLKRMHAQNDNAYTRKEFWAKWRWQHLTPRAVRICQVTEKMLQAGHLAPRPLLGIWHPKDDGWHDNLLVTAEVKAPTVESLLECPPPGLSRGKIIKIAARNLASFHRNHFVHGDFLPRNCCLDPVNTAFTFLDNDKTFHWNCIRPPFWMARRNLVQFAYNLLRLQGFQSCHEELSKLFLDEYGACTGHSVRQAWNSARARWERNHRTRPDAIVPLF